MQDLITPKDRLNLHPMRHWYCAGVCMAGTDRAGGTSTEPGTGALSRSLGLGHCIFFGVGSILGAGIYTLIGKVAGHGEGLTWVAFVIASVTAGLTAFAYAELSGMYPRSGGEFVYAQKALGDRVGAVLGWIIASNGIISAATVSLGLAGYFTQLMDLPLLPVAFGAITLFFIVNAIGIRSSSTVNIVLTVVEIAGLVAV
ncbi:MAG: APC family permease, partial [Flavobacteriales bacterium]